VLVWPESGADDQLREVTSLAKDSSDRLLIGTASAGVFIFDGKQGTSDSALEKLKGVAVWSMVSDSEETWLATERGLYLFQNGELNDIVPGVSARNIVVTSSGDEARQIWCVTSGHGLLRVTLDDLFGAIVSRLDVEQGLPSQRVFAVLSEKTDDGSESVIAG